MAAGWRRRFQVVEQRHHAIAAGAAEEIHALDRGKPLSIARQIAAPPGGVPSRRAGALNPLQFAGELRVGLLPHLAELLDQRGLGRRVDMIGRIDDRLAAGALDFNLQPFEVLT